MQRAREAELERVDVEALVKAVIDEVFDTAMTPTDASTTER